MKIFYLPFILQAMVMALDEMTHKKRGLPRWERVGHPLDTLSVLIALAYLVLNPYSEFNLKVFVALSLFSCILITKDEWVHARECHALEHWLHSLLYLLHPISFLCAGILWMKGEVSSLIGILSVITLFMFYQIIRWGVLWQLRNR